MSKPCSGPYFSWWCMAAVDYVRHWPRRLRAVGHLWAHSHLFQDEPECQERWFEGQKLGQSSRAGIRDQGGDRYRPLFFSRAVALVIDLRSSYGIFGREVSLKVLIGLNELKVTRNRVGNSLEEGCRVWWEMFGMAWSEFQLCLSSDQVLRLSSRSDVILEGWYEVIHLRNALLAPQVFELSFSWNLLSEASRKQISEISMI